MSDYEVHPCGTTDRIEKLLKQRDEARRDAVEAEAYVGELETKLAKTRTFIYELWDSQGHDASELRDLTDCLDSSPQPNDKLRQMYADYRKAISDGRLKVAPTDAAQAREEALKEAASLFNDGWERDVILSLINKEKP